MTAVTALRANISARLTAQNLSISEAERRADLGKATLSRFLAETTDALSIEVAEKLAPVLGTTLAEMIGSPANEVSSALRQLHPDQLVKSPLNPRKATALDAGAISDLARSIAEKGVLQNLIARPHPSGDGTFEIVAGERRWRAACHAITKEMVAPDFTLPVAVRDLSDEQLIEIALVENIDRADMSPLEEADAIAFLHERARAEGKQKDFTKRLAEATGKSDRWIQERVKLSRELTETARDQLVEGKLSLQMAKELSQVPAAAQTHALDKIAKGHSGYRTAEHLLMSLAADLPKADEAIFDLGEYDGGFVVRDKVKYFADAKQAERLQKAAIKAQADTYTATRAFVETYSGWNLDTAFPPAPKSLKAKSGEQVCPWGVVIERDRFKVTFHDRRLKPAADETESSAQNGNSVTLVAKRDAAREPVRQKLAEQLALLFEARPVDAARALLLNVIDTDGTLLDLDGIETFDRETMAKALDILGVKLPGEPEGYRDNEELQLAWEREALDAIVGGLKSASERTIFRCLALLSKPSRDSWTLSRKLTPTDAALMRLLDAEIPEPLQHELDGGDILDVAGPPAEAAEAQGDETAEDDGAEDTDEGDEA